MSSDCYNNCLQSGCTRDLLTNAYCDIECSSKVCAYDNRYCVKFIQAECSPGCDRAKFDAQD